MPIHRFKRQSAGHKFIALLVLVTAWIAQAPGYAQESFEFSEDLFYERLDERGDTFDEARAAVAYEFDEYEAAEIAAYLCAPVPDPACEGSRVLAAWTVYLNGLYDGQSIADIVSDMSAADEILAFAILVYWCTPPAGYGCEDGEDDEFDEFEEFEEFEEYDERQSDFADEDQVKERPASRVSGAQFFGGDEEDKRESRTRN